MATPHVSAVAAMLMGYFPDCHANQIRNAMINAIRQPPINKKGWNKEYGWGIVDFGAAHYALSSAGCAGAGGQSPAEAGITPSNMAQGGAYQKTIGCTEDYHCFIGPDFPARYCNKVPKAHECVEGTLNPSPSPTTPNPSPSPTASEPTTPKPTTLSPTSQPSQSPTTGQPTISQVSIVSIYNCSMVKR